MVLSTCVLDAFIQGQIFQRIQDKRNNFPTGPSRTFCFRLQSRWPKIVLMSLRPHSTDTRNALMPPLSPRAPLARARRVVGLWGRQPGGFWFCASPTAVGLGVGRLVPRSSDLGFLVNDANAREGFFGSGLSGRSLNFPSTRAACCRTGRINGGRSIASVRTTTSATFARRKSDCLRFNDGLHGQ